MLDSKKIRVALRERDMTQAQLAAQLALPPPRVSEYLTGARAAPVTFQARVEQALAVPPGTFTLVSRVTQ